MVEILKKIETPALVFAAVVIFFQHKQYKMHNDIINRYMDISERNAKAIQELTTWLKTRFERDGK